MSEEENKQQTFKEIMWQFGPKKYRDEIRSGRRNLKFKGKHLSWVWRDKDGNIVETYGRNFQLPVKKKRGRKKKSE